MKKNLVEIIKNNPGCIEVIDNDRSIDEIRNDFEKWFLDYFSDAGITDEDMKYIRDGNGYSELGVDTAWIVWQASRANALEIVPFYLVGWVKRSETHRNGNKL